MSRESTAMIIVGPRSIAPWGDRAWRVSGSLQLVENSQPYWIITPTQPAEHRVSQNEVLVETLHPDAVTESLVLCLAATFAGDAAEQILVASHNIAVSGTGERTIPAGWDLSAPETLSSLARAVSQQVRLGVVMLSDFSIMTAEVINQLRLLGFDVDVMSANSGIPHA